MIEPCEHGLLDVGEGNRIYWEASGSPGGKPAVVLHGGPGSGCTPALRRYFDPDANRIVPFDQRGCGRSTPHAADPAVDLSTNTTHHLLADIERLRSRLGVERWLVFGGSWGSTRGLAYAELHRARVTELVLWGIAHVPPPRDPLDHARRRPAVPRAVSALPRRVPEADRDGDLVAAYARVLADPDPAVRERAARDWCDWEDDDDPAFRMAFARLVTHYWRHAAWHEDGILLRDAPRLAAIPGVLVHGRLDVSGPLDTAWGLARAWPDGEPRVIDEAGHSPGDAVMAEALVAATDRFARA